MLQKATTTLKQPHNTPHPTNGDQCQVTPNPKSRKPQQEPKKNLVTRFSLPGDTPTRNSLNAATSNPDTCTSNPKLPEPTWRHIECLNRLVLESQVLKTRVLEGAMPESGFVLESVVLEPGKR